MVEQVDRDASEVTQADIDAAKQFQKLALQWTHDALTGKVELATDGTAKDYKHPVFQCFKHHRIAAEARGMAEIERLRLALNNARKSLCQCYRSSREDALENHPDWAEHIADINRESGEALALIDASLNGGQHE